MEPRPYVTNGLSRNVRSALKQRFMAEALQSNPDATPNILIRSQNECYACRLKSLTTCLNSCQSNASPNAHGSNIELVEVHLSADPGVGGASADGS